MPIKIKNDGAWVEVGSSSGVKTYDLSVEQTGDPATDANPVLRLTDGSTNDDITLTGSGSVSISRTSGTEITISADTDSNTTYTLPTFGTTNGASGLSLTDNDGGTDDVNITGTGGITVVGNAGNDTLTIDGSGASGKTYTFSSVQDVTNVNLRLNDGTTNQDVLLTAGPGITLNNVTTSGFEISTNSNAGKTYDLSVEQTGDPATDANPVLRLTDGSTNDDITLTGSGSVSISRTSGTEITITGSAAGGLSLGASVTDILDLTGSTLSADDAGADKIVFWDDDPGKLTYLTVGNGLAISETEITATGTASFSVPGSDKQVLFNDGTFLAAASTLEYDKTGSGTLIKTGGYIRCTKSGGADLVDITEDGGVEIKRTSDTAGPFIDFKSTGSDADARIQMDRTAGDNFSSIKFYTFNGTNGFSSERLRIGREGEIGIAGANYGTPGQVLTSGGPGASVSWAASGGGTAETIAVTDEGVTTWRNIVYVGAAGAAKTLLCNDDEGVVHGLQVRGSDGAMRVKGDITAFRGSDRRLKDNISPIKNALAKVSSISGNTFTWNEKSTDDKQGNDDTGVIAQEITALGLPGVTTTREDGTQAVMYEKLVPLLIEAIKELKEEVDELKSRS
jgi:hypothetical protein